MGEQSDYWNGVLRTEIIEPFIDKKTNNKQNSFSINLTELLQKDEIFWMFIINESLHKRTEFQKNLFKICEICELSSILKKIKKIKKSVIHR